MYEFDVAQDLQLSLEGWLKVQIQRVHFLQPEISTII